MGRRKARRGSDKGPTGGKQRSIRFDAHEDEGERTYKSGPPPAAVHLRQMRSGEALAKLEMMVDLHRRRGDRELLVVHGKGMRSEGGVPVIAPLVLDWLKDNPERVASWRRAPNDWGGEGALVVVLRRD